jgi:hypothetical protein
VQNYFITRVPSLTVIISHTAIISTKEKKRLSILPPLSDDEDSEPGEAARTGRVVGEFEGCSN